MNITGASSIKVSWATSVALVLLWSRFPSCTVDTQTVVEEIDLTIAYPYSVYLPAILRWVHLSPVLESVYLSIARTRKALE